MDVTRRLSTEAYGALREALSVVTWNKKPFASMMRGLLRDSPALLTGLNFDDPKRMVVDELVDRLVDEESRWQETTLALMVEVGSMTRFPNLEAQPDRDFQVARAQAAVAALKALTGKFAAQTALDEQGAAQRAADKAKAERNRVFTAELRGLRDRYLAMEDAIDPHQRGLDFEKLLNSLFVLFDMEPRTSFSLEREQIDGSLTFNTDDYVLEAKWWTKPVGRPDGDVFAKKVERKGKNALGLFVSVSGFAQTLYDEYAQSASFVTMDGGDLYAVLDGLVRLDDLLHAKRRHMNETGSCFMPLSHAI